MITWGVNPTPPAPETSTKKKKITISFIQTKKQNTKKKQEQELPRASSCFFPDPGGLPRCFFAGASADAVPAESPALPPPAAAEAGGEVWVGARPRAMLPSGEYLRGRPRFFLAREQGFIGEEEPSYAAEAGKGSDEGGG